MPEPVKGEKRAAYVSRFMKSGEAKASFPKQNQRVAVAYALFKRAQQDKRK